jgi:hypothetical protein
LDVGRFTLAGGDLHIVHSHLPRSSANINLIH